MCTHFGSVLKIAINKCICLSSYKCQLDNVHYKKRIDLIFKICKVELQKGGVILHSFFKEIILIKNKTILKLKSTHCQQSSLGALYFQPCVTSKLHLENHQVHIANSKCHVYHLGMHVTVALLLINTAIFQTKPNQLTTKIFLIPYQETFTKIQLSFKQMKEIPEYFSAF